jgi:hypothetical protein
MRLALAAVENTKATVPEILALPGDQKELVFETGEAPARRLMAKLVEFVGERSLNELFGDLGIKDRAAAKRRKMAEEDAKEHAAAEREMTLQDRFNDIEEHLRLARGAATDKALWMSFSRQQHADLKAIFDDAAERITEIYVKTHGRKTT